MTDSSSRLPDQTDLKKETVEKSDVVSEAAQVRISPVESGRLLPPEIDTSSGEGTGCSWREDPAYAALLFSAFTMGFSLPLGRLGIAVALILTIRDVVRGRRRWLIPSTAKAWWLHLLIALVTTLAVAATNTDPLIIPGRSASKLTKLIWFMAIPIVPTLVNSRARFWQLATAFTMGAGIDAARVLLYNTVAAWVQVTLPFPDDPAPSEAGQRLLGITDSLGITEKLHKWISRHWRARTYGDALAKLGGMGMAQRLMSAFAASLALTFYSSRSGGARRTTLRRMALTIWLAAGLLFALKRGPWISAALVALPLLVAGLRLRRAVPLLLLTLVALLALPQARTRLAELPQEFTFDKGGRALMWCHIVPGLRRDHPWGVGFRALTNDKMRTYTRRVELYQNHVHSNPLQVLVELGWQGLASYLCWMTLALWQAVVLLRRGFGRRREEAGVAVEAQQMDGLSRPDDDIFLRAVPLVILATLILNGIVEYNLGDAEVVLVYGFSIGLAALSAGSCRRRAVCREGRLSPRP